MLLCLVDVPGACGTLKKVASIVRIFQLLFLVNANICIKSDICNYSEAP